MNGREIILEELIENTNKMLIDIEEQEDIEPGFSVAHELAEELLQELRRLES